MSVEHLSWKFESLSEQLKREEVAREAVERRGAILAAEVSAAEESAAARAGAQTFELRDGETALSALRASANGFSERVAREARRAEAEQSEGATLQALCKEIEEECRLEQAACDRFAAQLAAQDRENARESCESDEMTRRCRQLQSDTRVSMEDLRIAQQRALLVRNEIQALQAGFEDARSQTQRAQAEGDSFRQRAEERRAQLVGRRSQVERLLAEADAQRSDAQARAQRHALLEDQQVAQAQRLASLHQEVRVAKHEAHLRQTELHAEQELINGSGAPALGVPTAGGLSEEYRGLQKRVSQASQDASALRRKLQETESSLEAVERRRAGQRSERAALQSMCDERIEQERRVSSSAHNLRRARHSEDLAFEDMQNELQAAFRSREALAEDLVWNTKARDTLLSRMSRLRPEIAEADGRCQQLEDALARNARSMEDELVQRRHFRQEAAAAEEALRDLSRREGVLPSESPRLPRPASARSCAAAEPFAPPAAASFGQRTYAEPLAACRTPSREAEWRSRWQPPPFPQGQLLPS